MNIKAMLLILMLLVFGLACDFWRPGSGFMPPVPTLDPQMNDFGDAPDPGYPTKLASNGARTHDVHQFWLGPCQNVPTVELDAKLVDRDENDDGVTWEASAGTVLLRITVCNGSNKEQKVYLNALIDANGDGQWKNFSGPGGPVFEHFVVNQIVYLRPNDFVTVNARAPLALGVLETWMRFMVSDAPVYFGTYGWDGTGAFAIGEVEDYHIKPEIPTRTPTPTSTPTYTPTPTSTPTPTPTRRKMFIITVCGGTPVFDKPNGKQIGIVKETREGEELGRSGDWVNIQIKNDIGWIKASGLAINGVCHSPTQTTPSLPGGK